MLPVFFILLTVRWQGSRSALGERWIFELSPKFRVHISFESKHSVFGVTHSKRFEKSLIIRTNVESMFCERESCWLEKLAPYSCHGYPALVWPAIVNVLTWWKNVIGLWINHQRSNIFVLCCGNQLDHRYKIGQEFPQIRYFASLTWKRFGNRHVRSLV